MLRAYLSNFMVFNPSKSFFYGLIQLEVIQIQFITIKAFGIFSLQVIGYKKANENQASYIPNYKSIEEQPV